MFITLFVFLSNPTSCINIYLQRNKHQCFELKNNTNFDIGACLSMGGVKISETVYYVIVYYVIIYYIGCVSYLY